MAARDATSFRPPRSDGHARRAMAAPGGVIATADRKPAPQPRVSTSLRAGFGAFTLTTCVRRALTFDPHTSASLAPEVDRRAHRGRLR